MMMMMTSLRRRWSRQVGQSSNRRCQPSRQAHVKPPFWQIKYLLAFLLSFLSGYDDLAMHIGNTLFHNFCNLLFLLGPGLAFGWLGLGGSSGGYSSHGYISNGVPRGAQGPLWCKTETNGVPRRPSLVQNSDYRVPTGAFSGAKPWLTECHQGPSLVQNRY